MNINQDATNAVSFYNSLSWEEIFKVDPDFEENLTESFVSLFNFLKSTNPFAKAEWRKSDSFSWVMVKFYNSSEELREKQVMLKDLADTLDGIKEYSSWRLSSLELMPY